MIDWPLYFPNDCPPDDAKDTDNKVFRFVADSPLTMSDFRIYKEMHPNQVYGRLECQACGLSVYLDYNDVVEAKRNIPGFSKKQIAVGQLIPGDGVIKPTPSLKDSSHHTWWKNPNIKILDRFNVESKEYLK